MPLRKVKNRPGKACQGLARVAGRLPVQGAEMALAPPRRIPDTDISSPQ